MESETDSSLRIKRRLKLRIPQNITRQNIIDAIEKDIKPVGWPPKNNSTTYDVLYEGKRYPPKIVVMYANKYANGELFDVNNFSGGEATTNRFFRARGFEILPKKEDDSRFSYTDPSSSEDPFSIKEKNKISQERENRRKKWDQIRAQNNAENVSPILLREMNIYGGAAGIYRDKKTTTSLSEDDAGITISVLLTGEYDDDLGEESLVYHCPDTDRPGITDENDIKATQNAMKFQLPIFIITHSKTENKKRDLRFGFVTGWNDANRTFLIEFSQTGETQPVPVPTVDEDPFIITKNDERTSKKSFSPKRDPKFRFDVKQRYGLKCAVCSMTIDDLLTAAHIIPKGSGYSNDNVRNGIVLCHNHHDAFDKHLFGIHPDTKKIVFRSKGPSSSDMKIECETLSPKKNSPHIEALRWRYKKFEESFHEKLNTDFCK